MLTAFLLNIVMVRVLGPSDSGIFFFTLNSFALFLLLISCSLESGLGFFSARPDLSPKAAAGLSIAWASLGTALLIFFLPLVGPGLNQGWLLFFNIAYFWGSLLIVFFSALFQAKQDFTRPGIIIVVINLILLLCLIVSSPAVFSFSGWQKIYAWYALATVVEGVLLAAWYMIRYAGRPAITLPNPILTRQILGYAFRAFLSNLLYFLIYRLDYWLVHYFHTGDHLLGNYIQASKIAQLFLILPGILATPVFSITASEKRPGIHESVLQLSRIIFMLLLPGLAGLALVGYWLFPTVFGAGFTDMYLPFVLLIPGILAIAILNPYGAFYAGRNQISVNIKGALLGIPVMVILDTLLIPRWGIAGAAIGSSIGYMVYTWYILRQFTRTYDVAWYECFWPGQSDWQLVRSILLRRL
jgi:O-antigen/teichoic acid export membrane protein